MGKFRFLVLLLAGSGFLLVGTAPAAAGVLVAGAVLARALAWMGRQAR